ncbi:MAG: hypothetical protein NZM41_08445 [Saprospiraceae bacterium]|nr:hypothetical protein [Saprospiraceae bacterium]
MRHSRALCTAEIEALLRHFAAQQNVSVSTHKQALCALLFPRGEASVSERPLLGSRRCRQALTQVGAVLLRDDETRPQKKSRPRAGRLLRVQHAAGLPLVAWEPLGQLDKLARCASIVPAPPAALRRGLPVSPRAAPLAALATP